MFKNIVRLCFGSSLAQGLQLLALPLLSYLYTPGAMGIYFFTVSLSSISSVLFSLQLHQAIPNKKNKDAVVEILKTIAILSILIFSLMLVFVLLTNFDSGELIVWAGLFSFTSLSIATLRMILTREGEFRLLNFLMLSRSVMIIVGQSLFFFIDEQRGLLFGFIVGEVAATLLILYISKTHKKLNFKKSFSIKRVIRDNRDFAYFGAPQEFVAVLAFGLPIIIIKSIYGEEFSGQFGMAQRLIFPVATILLGAVINTLQSEYGTQEKYKLFKDLTFKRVLLGLIIVIFGSPIIYYGSGIFMSLILSNDWEIAVEVSRYISLWAIALIVSAPFRASCKIYSLQFLLLAADFIVFSSLICLYLVKGWTSLEFIALVKLFTLLGVFQNSVVVLGVSLYIKKSLSESRKNEMFYG